MYDKVSTEKGGLPQQKDLTLEIATIRAWLVSSGALRRWTAEKNMIMHGLTKDHKEALGPSVQRDATLIRERRLNQSVHAKRNLSILYTSKSGRDAQRVLFFVEIEWKQFNAQRCVFFELIFLVRMCILDGVFFLK